MSENVRVRFAPSPTGFFHIGSARTALFNWLYARHTGGTFVLRIEDTDSERNRDAYLQVLLDGMKWLGLDWDEGPEKGGAYGPYFQSRRKDIYKKYLDRLVAANRAYEKDGAYYFRLLGERKTVYDEFKKESVERVEAAPVLIRDAVHGDVSRAENKDFVLWRSNGDPSFHFVNVVDDIEMKITHVIRGEDHLSNTSKHIELFNALGAPAPRYAHIPLILKEVGQGKMSKRDRGALIEEYRDRRFIPDAVRNYVALLGWNPKIDREIMPIAEIIERFDLPGINKSNARFDEKKMRHFNTVYTQALPAGEFRERAIDTLRAANAPLGGLPPAYVDSVIALCQPKLAGLEDLPEYAAYFWTEDFPEDAAAREKTLKKTGVEGALAALAQFMEFADAQENWADEAALEAALKAFAEKNGARTGDYIHIGRLALSGRGAGPSFYGLLRVLGKEKTLARCERWRARNA